MNTEITLALPEYLYERAQRLAELTGKAVSDVLSSAIDRSLPPLISELDRSPVQSLSNEIVLTLADGMMDTNQSDRMTALQAKQQAGTIDDDERTELHLLMDIYNAGQLRKTQALVEAVKRGLRPSGNS